MKVIKLVMLGVCMLTFFGIEAQNPARPDQAAGMENAKADSTTVTGADANQQVNNESGAITTDPRASNTPAVAQTTSSQSGSPAILSAENGKLRDGTNNVQRASMNMAGSPVRNIRLRDRNIDTDVEIKASQSQRNNQGTVQKKAGTVSGNKSGQSNSQPDQGNIKNKAGSDTQKKSRQPKRRGQS
ncbi:MAG: hypothetical protein ABIR06_14325 [Cyclobacteriaceae bacterium]